ncbi:MAG: Nif3-like dinuclear metal center hexameric protein [Ktedonobacteraceae bacterium]
MEKEMTSLSLAALATYLDSYLSCANIPNDQSGIYRPSSHEVRRIGLALEPWAGMDTWVRQRNLDALFLHRPWHLDMPTLPEHVGVLAYHLAFDLTLTLGFNRRLADVLQMTQLVPFAYKDNLLLGMLGDIPPTAASTFIETLAETFGTRPSVEKSRSETIGRLAIVGAMNDSLIRDADAQGADLYITGQFRQLARVAVNETEMMVAVIGHRTSELWGLRTLASLLRERWTSLDVVVAPTDVW